MINFLIKHKTDKGYTLLFAVLVSSLVLVVGMSILTISKKEFTLSSSARDSVYAFYAADAGLECALYWDSQGYLATSTSRYFTCNNFLSANPTSFSRIGESLAYEYTFHVPISSGSTGACAIVKVTQSYVGSPLLPLTSIDSSGYNTGWNGSSCTKSGQRIVERALRYSY